MLAEAEKVTEEREKWADSTDDLELGLQLSQRDEMWGKAAVLEPPGTREQCSCESLMPALRWS